MYTLRSPPKSDTSTTAGGPFNLYRKFITNDGVSSFMWCKEVAPGYIRTQDGSLYRDKGSNVSLTIDDYIPKREELHELCGDMKNKDAEADKEQERALTQQRLEEAYGRAYPSEDDLDDDLPWTDDSQVFPKSDEDSSGPAPLGERLRYARLVHNCHNDEVICREQLMGDLISMENKEFVSFIQDDPETAATAFAELIDIVLEMNTWLSQDPSSQDLAFDLEECLDMGNQQYHVQAMQRLTQLRKAQYNKLMEMALAKEAAKTEEKKVA